MFRNILKLCAVAAAFFVSVSAGAQSFKEKVVADRNAAGIVYHPYVCGDLSDTPAPRGYKPFYISHFGRHGSRYHTSSKYFSPALEVLGNAASCGNLTEAGLLLFGDVSRVAAESKGMDGALSPLGGREHKEIAVRMSERFPEVFKSAERTEVECVSSTVQRCIVSMAYFTQALAACRPHLHFENFSGQKYFEYIMNPGKYYEELGKEAKHIADSLRNAMCSYDKTFKRIFKDADAAVQSREQALDFMDSFFMTASICADLELEDVDIFKYFDIDELCEVSAVRNARTYYLCCNSLESGERTTSAGDLLLKDFIQRADRALEDGSRRAADLRFGHDTGLMPLTGLVGIREMCERWSVYGCWEHWLSSEMIPMASNFQMIFYRSSKEKDVLVKLLYNEQETYIPALSPFSGPYYKWQDLREFFISKL